MGLRRKLAQLERQVHPYPSEELLEEWSKKACTHLTDHELELITEAFDREGEDLAHLTEEEQGAFAQVFYHLERAKHGI